MVLIPSFSLLLFRKNKKTEQNAKFLIRCGAVVLTRRPCSAVIE